MPLWTVSARRPWRAFLRALVVPANYVALAAIVRTARRPWDVLLRYALGRGTYPATIEVRTPTGVVALRVDSHHDVRTVNEVFFRGDYHTDARCRVVVDLGANIGISAAYFLSRRADGRVHAFEPLARNVERLRANLAPFADRVVVHPVAVAVEAGTARFGYEPTGRYGGIGNETGAYVDVTCVELNAALREVLEREGAIDLLKIDVETLEADLLAALDQELAAVIPVIHVELQPTDNPLWRSHRMEQRGSVATFIRD